jgi:sialate O-acetylesterase
MKPSLCLLMLVALPVVAEVVLSAIFTSNMVLQRDMPHPVWGTAAPGEQVTVTFAGQEKTAVAGQNGKWQVTLDPLTLDKEGGDLKISGPANNVICQNVVVGDVWLCGGQSNMEMNFEARWGLINREKEMQDAKFPLVRHIKIAHVCAELPDDTVKCDSAWQTCDSPENMEKCTAVGYFFARRVIRETDIPIGLLDDNWSASRIEPFIPYKAFDANRAHLDGFVEKLDAAFVDTPQGKAYRRGPNDDKLLLATIQYNQMIHPLTRLPIKGVLWYQGCTNAYENKYHWLMKTMVEGWRQAWGYDFPFYYVQLSGLENHYSYFAYSGFASLREQQRKALALIPNSAMVVTLDIGLVRDIHPKNKQDVGDRLARIALARDYDKDIVWQGPTFREMKIEGNKIRIFLDNAAGLKHAVKRGNGLNPPEPDKDRIANFAIAGKDQSWYNASVAIEGETLVVSCPYVPEPVAVRHAMIGYAYFPIGIYNGADLPLEPFRTDDWGL